MNATILLLRGNNYDTIKWNIDAHNHNTYIRRYGKVESLYLPIDSLM